MNSVRYPEVWVVGIVWTRGFVSEYYGNEAIMREAIMREVVMREAANRESELLYEKDSCYKWRWATGREDKQL